LNDEDMRGEAASYDLLRANVTANPKRAQLQAPDLAVTLFSILLG
jgi:hypothetical protein